MDKVRIWAIRAGSRGQADSVFLDDNHIAFSSLAIDDDVGLLPQERVAFKDLIAHSGDHTEDGSSQRSDAIHAGQIYRFVHEIRIGDRIIYPRKSDRTLHWGTVTGPYIYHGEDGLDFAHRRPVRWIAQATRDDFSPGALFEIGSLLSLFRVREFALEFLKAFEADDAYEILRNCEHLDEDFAAGARDIGEATNDFIAKMIRTKLKGTRFEPFIADLFRAMGYSAYTTKAVHDEGIDIIAHHDELGIEPPILKIQVKAREANINADSVKAFYAMVHDRDVGIFITTGNFTGPAIEFAKTKGNLRLMAGTELYSLIVKYYDKLAVDARQIIPMKWVLVADTPPLDL